MFLKWKFNFLSNSFPQTNKLTYIFQFYQFSRWISRLQTTMGCIGNLCYVLSLECYAMDSIFHHIQCCSKVSGLFPKFCSNCLITIHQYCIKHHLIIIQHKYCHQNHFFSIFIAPPYSIWGKFSSPLFNY